MKPQVRGNIVGIIIGVLPGAGADMAAWVSYAMSKRFSKTPEKFGTGHPEGLIEAGASNNASLASGWVPSLLFGIPGDTITAIAIGVLYMKGLNPGPTLFTERASSMYALYIIFIIANIIMIPLGIIMIRIASLVLRAPRASIMPVIVLLCAVGAFATGNNLYSVVLGRRIRRHRLRHGAQRLSGRGDGARHRHGHDGRAELRDLDHQVRRQHPAVLRAAGLGRAGLHDDRGPALAARRMVMEPGHGAEPSTDREQVGHRSCPAVHLSGGVSGALVSWIKIPLVARYINFLWLGASRMGIFPLVIVQQTRGAQQWAGWR